MANTVFSNINPAILARIKSLRLIDDVLMTIVFSGDNKAIESARNFLAMNILTPEIIAQGTGLPIEEVLSLKQQSNN